METRILGAGAEPAGNEKVTEASKNKIAGLKPEELKAEKLKAEELQPENSKPEDWQPENSKPEDWQLKNSKPEDWQPEELKAEGLKLNDSKPEGAEPEMAQEEAGPEAPAESMNDYERELEVSFRKIAAGDIISGTVISVSEEEVILDLRYYTQGVIKAGDMSKVPDFSLMNDVKIGETIEASVMQMDDGQGNIRLSRIEANQVLAWDKLEAYRTEGREFAVKISGITKGGVICYLEDVRGFIPASQLSLDYVEDLNLWLHKTVKVRVITVNRAKEKLVLSAKEILREEAKAARARKIAMIIPGTILEGKVESLTDFGAFVNLGDGISGLIHISQIARHKIKSAAEVLNVGDTVKVKVLKVNDGKISLSIKALEEEPRAEKIADFDYKSDGELTTSLGSLLANLKLN